MKTYTTKQIRNIGMVGHGGEGKTTLTEAMLFTSGAVSRMGSVDAGTATTDYDPEETKRHISIGAALAPIEWKDHKINVIDAPGYFDFEGEVLETLSVADAALIVVGAVSGVTVGAEKAWKLCKDRDLPRAFVVNRMDTENANFEKTFDALRGQFGPSVVPLQLPIMEGEKFTGYVDIIKLEGVQFDGKNRKSVPIPDSLETEVDHYREILVETAAESSEELMEKYFGGEEFTQEELIAGIRSGILSGSLAPVFCTAAVPQLGVARLLDNIVHYMPSPDEAAAKTGKNPKDDSDVTRTCSEAGPFSAQVFKTLTDNFVGKISLVKIYSGKLAVDTPIYNANAEKSEKIGTVYYMLGKKTYPIDSLCAGDIGALAKLQYTATGDSLCDPQNPVLFDKIEFAPPAISMAVTAKKRGEEDKVFGGLNKLLEEDGTFKLEKSAETGDMLLSGVGEMHLDVICAKLKNKFNVEAQLADPRIAYRETIRKSAKAQGRHKKQSGGHGQFGDVWVEFEPIFDGSAEFEFVDKVVGGVVPRNFIPAVEKGLREAVAKGVLAGYPMINIRCTLYDGSYHPVDSNEMAFKTAARLAYKKGCADAQPVLLEPIYCYKVVVPDDYMGDVIGDMNRRRGRILGMNPLGGGLQEVVAEVPYAEMFKYATDLRSMTQGRGAFTMAFERYDEVPAPIATKIIEKAKKEMEEDDE